MTLFLEPLGLKFLTVKTRRLPFQSLYLFLGSLVPLCFISHFAPVSLGLLVLSSNLLYAKVEDIWMVRKLGSWISYEDSHLFARSRH